MMQKKRKLRTIFLCILFIVMLENKQQQKTAIPPLFSISLCFRQQYVMQKKGKRTQQRAFFVNISN
jgi:hypothetical protein